MRHLTCLFLSVILFSGTLHAGEIYGSIVETDKAVANAPIEIHCKDRKLEIVTGRTGRDGSYRINVQSKGQCLLVLPRYSAQAIVFSYSAPSRYDFEVVKTKSGYELRRR